LDQEGCKGFLGALEKVVERVKRHLQEYGNNR
jgi:hypothetical protein